MSLNLLIVDADTDGMESVSYMLEQELGCCIDIVNSPVEAEMLMEKKKYSAVMAEPYKVGYYGNNSENPAVMFIHSLKEKNIPIILSTTQDEDRLKINFGMKIKDYAGYLEKPYNFRDAKEIISKVLGKKQE
jgi:DNA-binding NtrC family response regulator